MKIAISMPDETFEALEAAVAEAGVSRSAFMTSAIEEKLKRLLDDRLTEQANAALAAAGPQDLSFIHEASRRAFERTEWVW